MPSDAERSAGAIEDPARWRSTLRSLRVRMALSHGGLMLLILAVLGIAGQALLARELDRSATRDVEAAAAQEVDRLEELGTLSNPPDSDQPARSPIRMAVFGPDGLPVDGDEATPAWLRPRTEGVVDTRVGGQPVRVATRPVEVGGRPIGTVVAARSLASEAALVHRVRLLLLFGGLAAVAASALAGWLLAGRALRPVRRAYAAQRAFAADASHELRTPLAFVRQGVEVLGESRPELGVQVLQDVDYLSSLIDRLLLLARADDGRLHLPATAVDVGEVCRSAALRSREAHGTSIELAGPDHLVARADRVAAEAAVDAVLENVSVHGGGAAEVRWRPEGGRAVVEVRDHGPGLTAEQRQLAFRRFFRADPARARERGGAGLGLPIARRLLEAQGGAISLHDAPGGGLSVRIELPLGEREREGGQAETTERVPDPAMPGGERVG